MASKNSLAQDFIYTIGKLPQRWQEEWARLRKDEPETWVDDWESPDNVQESKFRPACAPVMKLRVQEYRLLFEKLSI